VKIGRHEPGVDCYGNKKSDVACFRRKLELQLLVYNSRKPMQCTGKLLKIKSKLILIPFTSFVEYIYIFLVVQNVVDKIDKETLRIGFRIDLTFLFKKITKKVFTIG
jgi:hypothetical protein